MVMNYSLDKMLIQDFFSNVTSSEATASVLGGLFEQGIDRVVGTAKAFVNFDYDFIMSDMIELIDPTTLVIEVLEHVEIDDALLRRIQVLRRKGYRIALDDFEDDFFTYPVIPMADIIKYDIMITPLDTLHKEVKEAIAMKKILLAEKIESKEDYEKAKIMGFHLFQGYFFSKPRIVLRGSNAKKSFKAVYSQILNELKNKDFSFDKLTSIIESDVNLSYRLLCVISRKKDEKDGNSIKRALIRMGIKEIERWISVLMLQDSASDKPDEVYRLSLIRSKFGEYVAERSSYKQRKDEVSIMCLFSMLDVILDSTMQEALDGLALSQDIIEALVYGTGHFKPLCILLKSYESGNWQAVDKYAKKIQLNSDELTNAYLSAIEWTQGVMSIF